MKKYFSLSALTKIGGTVDLIKIRFSKFSLVIISFLFLSSYNAFAQTTEMKIEGNLKYKLYTDVYYRYAIVTGNTINSDTDVVIPSYVYSNDGIRCLVSDVGESAFANCEFIKSVTFNSTLWIHEKAFYNCDNLSELDIKLDDNQGGIGPNAFAECSSLKKVTINISSFQGYECDIMDNAFAECNSLEEVTIKGSVQFGKRVFANCTSLKSASFSAHVIDEMFMNCSSLENVNIGNAPGIRNRAFYNCTSLKSINISKYCREIDLDAFDGCSSLLEVNVDEENPYFFSINGCFYNDNDGTHNTLKRVWGGYRSFIVPYHINVIDNCAFYNCAEMNSITVTTWVVKVNYNSFLGCNKLERISFLCKEPPYSNHYVINPAGNPEDITLYVPKGSKEAYANSADWKNFPIIKEMETVGISSDEKNIELSIDGEKSMPIDIDNPGNVQFVSEEWTSDDPSIAEVENGTVRGISEGETTINCVIFDEFGRNYRLSWTVKVEKMSGIDLPEQDNDEACEVYDLYGIKVNQSPYSKGIFIVKEGNKVVKKIIK